MSSSIALLICAGLVSSTPTNRTLVMVKYGGKALDCRQLPNMMARAFGTSRRLTDEDRIFENCLLNDDMVEDLSAIGVQIINSNCPATTDQISNYMKSLHDALDVVSFVEPDREVFLDTAPVRPSLRRAQNIDQCKANIRLGTYDPLSSCQPNLELIRMNHVWHEVESIRQINPLKEVVVAVIDSGIDTKHPDLVNQLWRNPNDGSVGYNFINNNNDPTDDNGHGTHCAGVIAAETNNGIGVASVTGALGEVMALKSFGSDGSGNLAETLRALDFALDNGAQISSHSYSDPNHSDLEEQAIINAAARGHILVASSGNERLSLDSNPVYPCAYAATNLCVAATTSGPNIPVVLAGFSNYGSAVNIAAPGVNILSTVPGTYERRSGTSMATPHVAAVAAVLASLGVIGQSITGTIIQSGRKVSNSDIPLLDAGGKGITEAIAQARAKLTPP
ncbi:Suppressor of the cold-sensitive snRNP bioproteinsis mutant brr1-1 [Perkinsus chesapeaki]|uniref:subtilisin n=1 Tax=Perkinsus chesapeaki TaxID=330153 RepID=A0A7J6KZ30_PERCH|nr:Suppressor of the cold-sensitive snRNP bioproteinsis mutant brr1-1 [Perkinsus chesapeaki]